MFHSLNALLSLGFFGFGVKSWTFFGRLCESWLFFGLSLESFAINLFHLSDFEILISGNCGFIVSKRNWHFQVHALVLFSV